MTPYPLHQAVRKGDLRRVEELLEAPGSQVDVNERDRKGWTPLRYAVSRNRDISLLRTLLHHGANIDDNLLSFALAAGDPEKVAVLLQAGANVYARREDNADALINAAYGLDASTDSRLTELLQLLIANGVSLTEVKQYGESAVRIFSQLGRFGALHFLLAAGANTHDLRFTPLLEAVAFGSSADVATAIENGADLEARDSWERTAWLLALQIGDIPKARLLLEHGAQKDAQGHRGKPALFYAIESGQVPMLKWLLAVGVDIKQKDPFGDTALIAAVISCEEESVELLLQAGADINEQGNANTALGNATTREIALLLMQWGADPRDLTEWARREILGYPAGPDEDLLEVSRDDFLENRAPRFGAQNPEQMQVAFWEAMIRSGMNAYQAEEVFGYTRDQSGTIPPTWCGSQRFGQSLTFLPDGRIVQVGGEFEDFYDPNFCIYNDVFVHDPDGTITIYGYPAEVFAPTDFHSATLIGNSLYLIGSVGYQGKRQYGETQVYRLDTNTFQIEHLSTGGEKPGWIFKHRATLAGPHEIEISGGEIITGSGEQEVYSANTAIFRLDVERLLWRVVTETAESEIEQNKSGS
jgi:ankyrin repeat protein